MQFELKETLPDFFDPLPRPGRNLSARPACKPECGPGWRGIIDRCCVRMDPRRAMAVAGDRMNDFKQGEELRGAFSAARARWVTTTIFLSPRGFRSSLSMNARDAR